MEKIPNRFGLVAKKKSVLDYKPLPIKADPPKTERPESGRLPNGRFAPGNSGGPGIPSRIAKRLEAFERRIWELTQGGEQIATELWNIAQGKYGAQPHHRIQALEILSNRIYGKIKEQHDISIGPGDDRPYAALPAEILEALIRGLPAPALPPSGDIVNGEVIETSAETSADAGESPAIPDDKPE